MAIFMSNTDSTRMIFKENFNRLFAEKGSSGKELAAYIGVSAPTITEWLKGRKVPRMDKVDKLCTFFQCNRSDLMEKYPHDAVADKEKFSQHEIDLMRAYKAAPDNTKKIVDVTLEPFIQK